MNLIGLYEEAVAAVKDPERDFSERIFLILTCMSEVALLVAMIGDLVTGENPREIAVLFATFVLVPVIVLTCLKKNRLKLAIRLIVIGLVLVIIPGIFFFGGGLKGGGIFWIIFAYMYVGLVLSGRWRGIMMVLITILALICYCTSWFFPALVYRHSQSMYYVDSFISLVLVGVLCNVMSWAQGLLFEMESERAKKEAERAEELSRAQNRFFSSMSHEIRTPINSILGLNELILRDEEATDDIVRDANGIQGSGKMLLALINDILDFSKIESGSMDIVPVDYKVGDMLSEIVNMMWLRAYDKGLGFEVDVDPDVPSVLYGDEIRIKQIIINLLNNAVKYTKEGHVGLRVDSREAGDDVVELMISVSDTGMGIRKEDIPYLFDVFKRVDEGKNRHIEGTGLGLSIVKQLIELMDGSVTVNSVYGEGSTFSFTVKQVVSDHGRIGELSIHNQQVVKRSRHESSFLAPEVRILIVDDNEMNLEVESRLLEDTDMGIDTARSGREALAKSLKVHYDAIFMDHLMPEMDGIECLELLRNQEGGLNRNTPVIVLTANAGSENREMYNIAGFDGYLVKPVSGDAMEETLIRHIPGEKIILQNVMMNGSEEIHASERYVEKLPVIITSSSMCDLPDTVIKKLNIPIIPFVIRTETGIFRDGVHLDADELVRYINAGREAVSSPPGEAEYAEFFGNMLRRAHHLIHIAITTGMSEDYMNASEAAKSFDNVSVINSECISSATGILVLIAYKLAAQGLSVKDIISELESVKKRLKCSFVIDTTKYMTRKGLVSQQADRIARAVNLHPALRMQNDKIGIFGIWMGRTKRAYKRYISRAFPSDVVPDEEVVFITYVDIPGETLLWIVEEVKKAADFENVILQQASAAISSNCGSGTFGIMYFVKSNKSYNISSYLDREEEESREKSEANKDSEAGSFEEEAELYDEESDTGEEEELYEEEAYNEYEAEPRDEGAALSEEETSDPGTEASLSGLKNIDVAAAIKNSGSEEAFKAVLKIFHESIPEKYEALSQYYEAGDWKNYTIKIHALKSSAKLVGAMELSEKARLLEEAGKEKDIQYIKEHHEDAMADFLEYKDTLSGLFGKTDEDSGDENGGRPVADEYLMESIYEGLHEAAEAMDCDMVEEIMKEIGGYAIPAGEKEKFNRIREKADMLDYNGILEELKKGE